MTEELKQLLQHLWANDFSEEVGNQMIVVSHFPSLRAGIADEFIYLEEVFRENEIDDIHDGYKPYIEEYEIFPVMAGYGNQTICVGTGKNNFGRVFYFDFDFGVFDLGCSLFEFCNSLVVSDGKL